MEESSRGFATLEIEGPGDALSSTFFGAEHGNSSVDDGASSGGGFIAVLWQKLEQHIPSSGKTNMTRSTRFAVVRLGVAICLVTIIGGVGYSFSGGSNNSADMDNAPLTDTASAGSNPTTTLLEQQQNPSTSTSSTTTTTARKDQFHDYMIRYNVSKEEDLLQEGSPQHLALYFMLQESSRSGSEKMEVPNGDPSAPDGYEFVTRYVLLVLYYSTNGERWTFNLNFHKTKLSDVCLEYSVLQYVTMETEYRGVACDESNQVITALFLSKFPFFCAPFVAVTVIEMDFYFSDGLKHLFLQSGTSRQK